MKINGQWTSNTCNKQYGLQLKPYNCVDEYSEINLPQGVYSIFSCFSQSSHDSLKSENKTERLTHGYQPIVNSKLQGQFNLKLE